ncbi:unnamed protein product [Phytophthora lilii]|uniref:Unnamed protein product n=1 Tax=Phytophthora lilii TaxID=2077276 RepID=A0A9W6TE97_9STRA|nr:unnamed protein product [Phytophthora lilii]
MNSDENSTAFQQPLELFHDADAPLAQTASTTERCVTSGTCRVDHQPVEKHISTKMLVSMLSSSTPLSHDV